MLSFQLPAHLLKIQTWESHSVALLPSSRLSSCWTVFQLLLKAAPRLFDFMKQASLSPSQIKSKGFRRREEPVCVWKSFILYQSTLSSFALIITLLSFPFRKPEQNLYLQRYLVLSHFLHSFINQCHFSVSSFHLSYCITFIFVETNPVIPAPWPVLWWLFFFFIKTFYYLWVTALQIAYEMLLYLG